MPKTTLRRYRNCVCSILLGASTCCLHAQTPLTITLSPNSLGRTIPSDFEGISFESFTAVNLGTTSYPTTNSPVNDPSTAWFNSANSPLGPVLQRIGVKNIRIGGVSTEVPTQFDSNATYPQQYDAAYVSDFVQQYGMELVWSLPVENNYNVSTYTTYAQNMVTTQQSKGQNFQMIWEIGNEPSVNAATYDTRFDAYMNSLRSALGTSVLLLGPSEVANSNDINALMQDPDYDSSTAPFHGNIADFSHHLYPFGGASGQSSVNAAIETMLANNNSNYFANYKGWATTAVSYGYSTRYDEANSFSDGGYPGASNAFAAALWGLDLLEYYSHNTTCSGMNFHEGVTGSYYGPFTPQSLSSNYTVQGLGYGMLAFSTEGIGQVIPESRSGSGASLNISAYATLLANGSETAVVINKTSVIAGDNTDVVLTVVPGKSYTTANVYYLRAPNDDPTQTTGITFGGGVITGSGAWGGKPKAFSADGNGNFDIPLSATQAAVINMSN